MRPEMHRPEITRPIEPERPPRAFVVLDLDGVVLRYPGYHTINPTDYSLMGQSFARFREAGGRFGVLTNRPPGDMQTTAYFLGANQGLWVTESGGSAYDVQRNTAMVLPRWIPYAEEKVPALRKHLQEDLGIRERPYALEDPQYIPGMGPVKTVITPPEAVPIGEYAHGVIIPYLETRGFLPDFQVAVGKAIDIDPRGLSKAQGMTDLLQLNGIDPLKTPTLFIADHKRDIAGAQALLQLGGSVAAVGNADIQYKDFVRDTGGFVAPSDSAYHGSVAHIMEELLKKL